MMDHKVNGSAGAFLTLGFTFPKHPQFLANKIDHHPYDGCYQYSKEFIHYPTKFFPK